MKVGLNLFSIKDHIKTEEDFLNTALRLREMGYDFLQYSGAPFDAERIGRVSKASGMPVVLTHVPYERIIGDTENLMREHESFGCRNIGLGSLPHHLIREQDEALRDIEKMEQAAQRMEKEGFHFFYHNHQKEFVKIQGETYYDRLIREAPSLHFTLDTYWLQNGGMDIVEMVRRLKGRIGCVHLKDYTVGLNPRYPEEDKIAAIFAPVGDGSLNFSAIIPEMEKAGTEYFIVEQDNANYYPDPFGQVKRSVDYLKGAF